MKDFIIIPARYASKRLPGKPLILINGISLVNRVISIAKQVSAIVDKTKVLVATDHESILEHCTSLGVACVLTSPDITSGSERALVACQNYGETPRFIINLQGDAPFISPEQVIAVLQRARLSNAGVVTPVIELTWQMLDKLRLHKTATPFSGTTCIRNLQGKAMWFSKNILPVIRNEVQLRELSDFSPVYQHLGLYCYSYEFLQWFLKTPMGFYEKLEELEQLRFLENGKEILTEVVLPARISMSGIDSRLDVELAEKNIREFGDPFIFL
jgi:3-deoxy-manno-octulosonate cytidylyltransferase (CMP-KDO synthetase)